MAKTETNGKLLLVDDDSVCAFSIRRMLKKMDNACELLTATDGKEALDVLRQEILSCANGQPQIVVMLDQHMPRMNGDEFLQAVQAIPELSDLTVYAFTSGGKPDPSLSELATQIAGYISKDQMQESLNIVLRATRGILYQQTPETGTRH